MLRIVSAPSTVTKLPRMISTEEDSPEYSAPIEMESTQSINNKYKCDQCGVLFGKPSKLKSHIKSVHENKRPFQCNQCPDTFKRKDHLTRHIASKHAENRSAYKCPFE